MAKSKLKGRGPGSGFGPKIEIWGVQKLRFGGSKNRDLGRFLVFWGFLKVPGGKTFHISAQISAILG